MIIRKMGTVMQINELDFDAAEEVDGYAQKLIDEILDYLPKKKHGLIRRLLEEGIRQQYIVRNFNSKGDVSPRTGKTLSLIAPSPHLGYGTKAEADNRNKTQVRSAAVSRGKRKKSTKTVEEMKEEFTPEVMQEVAEQLMEGNSELADLLDELKISAGGRYPQRQNYIKSRGFLDEDLNRLEEMVESIEGTVSQGDIKSFQEFIAKVKPNNRWARFVVTEQKMKLETIMDMMVQKLDLNKSVWKSTLKKSKMSDLIDEMLGKLSTDTFEKDR